MSKFDDFNLDLIKVSSVSEYDDKERSSGPCVSWAITSVITSNIASTLSTVTETCHEDYTNGNQTCYCSPSDMTSCRNGKAPRC